MNKIMSKNIKHIIFIFIMIIICIYTYFNYNSKIKFDENYSKDFIKAVNYIKNGDYIKSYEVINKSSEVEKELVQTILLYKFINEISTYIKIDEKIAKESENITDYLTYTYIYQKDTKYQKSIDKMYADEYNKLFDVKKNLPKEIMFEDIYELYDKYLELIELDKDTFKNYEYKIKKENTKTVKLLQNIGNKMTEVGTLSEEAQGRHPSSSIPKEYLILLELE